MSERDIKELEDKNNSTFNQLISKINSIPQAPPLAQVEDAKKIKFHTNVDKTTHEDKQNWQRRKARKDHKDENSNAMTKIIKQRQFEKQQRKWKRRNENRKAASIVVDSGASSTCIRTADKKHVEVLDEDSPKIFLNANGTESKAGKKAKLPYNMRMPAVDADMVDDLAKNSLLSTGKLADADYVTVFTKDEVRIFDAEAAKFNVEGKMVLKGWRCNETGLWRIPLRENWSNQNTETALLSQESSNILTNKAEFINNVYELPSTEQVVAWYHAAAGYPTKATWIKAIENGHYATWPLLTVKAVKKYFPEAEETDKGHMRRVKSGVRSTKAQIEEPEEVQQAAATLANLRRKHKDIYVVIKDAAEMIYTDQIYTDQTGQFPRNFIYTQIKIIFQLLRLYLERDFY